MHYLEAILKVLTVGLVLGAGLPAVFAIGLVAYSHGSGGAEADGTITHPNAALRALGLVLFAFVAVVIVLAILYITKSTIIHHFGVNPVPFLP